MASTVVFMTASLSIEALRDSHGSESIFRREASSLATYWDMSHTITATTTMTPNTGQFSKIHDTTASITSTKDTENITSAKEERINDTSKPLL